MGTRVFKTLKIDGSTVCEYLGSSDPEEDQQIVQQLLRRKSVQRTVSKSRAMFQHASSFARVASSIYEREIRADPARGSNVGAPFVVNATLSIEFFLKTLLVVAGDSHFDQELLSLHDSLSEDSQRELDAQAGVLAPLHGEQPSINFRDLLRPLDGVLEEWRSERGPPSVELFHFPQIVLAMQTCREVCARAVVREPER
jgi:hypothetical protein